VAGTGLMIRLMACLQEPTMNLELDKEELDLLESLVGSRISELHPEIRRSMDHEYKDNLKQELERFEGLLERLKSLGEAGA
jgi:hypothetical protein